jgi:hypothetical protein
MRGSVAAIVVLAAVALSPPANALSGPMPGSKLQNLAPSNVEPVVVVRRGGAVVRGPRGGVAAVGRTTMVRPPGYRPGVRPGYGRRYVRPAYRGVRAARSLPARRLALSRPQRQQHGPVRRPLRVTAGITPIPAGPKAFGASAHKQD